MGSGDWFKTIISKKKIKHDQQKHVKGVASEKSNGFKRKNHSHKGSNKLYDRIVSRNPGNSQMAIEDIAAIRIQIAFRSFSARKRLRYLKGMHRLLALTQEHPVTKQASTTLSYLQSWSKIQTQIRARRANMVTEGRIRQKKQDNQLKLEAKLHDLVVEWSGGSDTMDEILARIHQREEAAVKRERTLAYAYSHQWRANSGLNFGAYEFAKGTWGWSWTERWIAARPWETRLPSQPASANKTKTVKCVTNVHPSAQSVSNPAKPAAADGEELTKGAAKPIAEKTSNQEPNSRTVASAYSKTKNGKIKA